MQAAEGLHGRAGLGAAGDDGILRQGEIPCRDGLAHIMSAEETVYTLLHHIAGTVSRHAAVIIGGKRFGRNAQGDVRAFSGLKHFRLGIGAQGAGGLSQAALGPLHIGLHHFPGSAGAGVPHTVGQQYLAF